MGSRPAVTVTVTEPSVAAPPVLVRRSAARVWWLPEVRWAAAATVLFGLGLLAYFAGGPAWLWWSLFVACYVTGGWEPGWAGLQALKDKTLDVDLLMVVALGGGSSPVVRMCRVGPARGRSKVSFLGGVTKRPVQVHGVAVASPDPGVAYVPGGFAVGHDHLHGAFGDFDCQWRIDRLAL